MTYSNATLALVAGKLNVAGQRIWMYSSADAAATIDAAGYMTDAYDFGVRAGDLVLAYDSGNKIWSAHTVVTCTKAAGADLGNGTTIGSSSNSD